MDEAEEMQVERLHEEADAGAADTDKLSYEIFSILESKFLFGYTDPHQLWMPKAPPAPAQASAAPGKAAAQRGKVCVLCVDGVGGGLRALLAGRALAHLEAALRRASGDPDARVADYFDLAAGTGAGGVFAAMLFSTHSRGAPLFHADDTWRLVADHAPRMFRRPAAAASLFCGGGKKKRPLAAPTAALEAATKAAFGEELTLRDTIKPVLISCYDLKTSAPLVFSRADALESESYDFRLCEVGRAAWSEAGRFEPAEVASVDGATSCAAVDGGPTMGSPAAAAITHVLHNKHEFPFVRGVEDLLVLSIGGCCSGGGSGSGPADEVDLRRVRRWGPKEWARPIARIAADGAADLVDHAVARAFGQCRSSNYLRIQAKRESMPPCGPDGEYEPTPGNVRALLAAADEMLKQRNVESVLFEGRRVGEQTNAEKLDWFAAELVAEHRSRGSRIAPTVAFKQAPRKPSALG